MPATKKKKAKTPTLSVVLSTFDATHGRPNYRQLRRADIREFAEVHRGEYRPTGLTPLLDATASFISDLRAAREDGAVTIGLLLDESGSMATNRDAVIAGINDFVEGMREAPRDPEAAGKVLAVISTDGGENASTETDRVAVQAMVADAEEDGYTFIFIGASMDAWGEAQGLGLSGTASGQSISSDNTPEGTRTMFAALASRGVGYVGDHGSYPGTFANNVALASDGTEIDLEQGASAVAPDPLLTAKVQSQITARGSAALAANLGAYDPADALERAAEATRSPGAS